MEPPESHEALRRMLAAVPGVVWDMPGNPADDSLVATFVSDFGERLLGHGPRRWLTEPRFWLELVHPDDRDRVAVEAAQIFESGASGVMQFRWMTADGNVLWVLTFANVVRGETGPCFRGFTFDITAYRRAVQRLGTQNAVTTILAGAPDVATATEPLLRAVGESLDWEVGALWLVDAPANVVRNTGVWSTRSFNGSRFVETTRFSEFTIGVGLPGRVWATGDAAWIEDVISDDNFPRAAVAAEEGLHAAFAFPIVAAGEVSGIIEFFSRRILEPDTDLLGMSRSIGAQVGQFVERKRAESALRESEQALREVLRSALDAVIGIDADGYITQWNSQATATFGWSEDEAIGRRLSDLIIPSRYRAQHEAGLAQARATGRGVVIGTRIEIDALRRDGGEFPVELAVTATRGARAYTFNAFVRDISDRRQRDQMKDDFLAFASHELRSPLTTVNGLSKWLAKQVSAGADLTDDGREAIEALSSESDRLVQMVELFLDLTRIESDRLLMELGPVDLAQLVADEAHLLKARHPGVSVTIDLNTASLPATLDELRVRQVLVNLLDNAAKYGTGEIYVTLQNAEEGHAMITVSDNGPGIGEEDLPHVFDRFYRALGQPQKGLGIGLFVCSQIVQRLGGRIVADNGPAGGAIFTVDLPVIAPIEHDETVDPAAQTG